MTSSASSGERRLSSVNTRRPSKLATGAARPGLAGALLPERTDAILREVRDGERLVSSRGVPLGRRRPSTRESGSPSHTIPSSTRVG